MEILFNHVSSLSTSRQRLMLTLELIVVIYTVEEKQFNVIIWCDITCVIHLPSTSVYIYMSLGARSVS